MGLIDRDYMRGKHPPTCTCCECDEGRRQLHDKEPEPVNITTKPYYQPVITEVKKKPLSKTLMLVILVFGILVIAVGIGMYMGIL